MSQAPRLSAVCLLFALAPSAWAGFGLGSPTDVRQLPGDLLLLDALAPQATLYPYDGGDEADAETFAMHALYPAFSMQILAIGGELHLYGAEIRYNRDGVERGVQYPELVLQVSKDCAPLGGRVVPGPVVDPDGDGVIDPAALRDWMELAPCH